MGKANRGGEPPDGGWGWAIVFASFMIHVVADGVAYTFGLFFEDITRELKTSYSAAAWVASIMGGMTYSAGPVASAFVNRFGCRTVSIAGSIIAAFGFAISYYANSVVQLYFSAGLLGGLGLGLIYLPAIVMVTCYFEKKRAFATGIAVCGSGFGTFLFAPLIKKLLVLLDWRLAFVATGGIILTCLIFSLLFRPIKVVDGDDEEKAQVVFPANEPHSPRPEIPNIVEPPKDYNDIDGKDSGSPKYLYRHPDGGGENISSMVSMDGPGKPIVQMLDVKQNETLTMSSSQPALPVGIGSIESLNRYASLQNKKRHSLKIPSLIASDLAEQSDARQRYKANRYSTIFPAGPILERKDVFYSGSLIKIPDFATLQEEKSSLDSTDAAQVDDDERPPDFVAQKEICGCIRCSPQFYNVLTTMLRVSLLKDPVFVLFAVSNFLTSIGYNVPYIYLVGMAEQNANQSGTGGNQTELLLSIIGIANTVSRIVLGYLSDKKWVNRLYLYNFALTGCGIATILAAHAYSIVALQIYSAVFGALVGVYVSLTSVILVDLLGLDKLTNAFGLLMLFQGVGTVIGPPIVGFLVDEYKDYKLGFGLAGGMIAFSGLILFIIPLIHKRQRASSLIKSTDCRKHLNPRDLQESKSILTNNNKAEIFSKSQEKLGERV